MSNWTTGYLTPGSEELFVGAFVMVILFTWVYMTYLLLFKANRKLLKPFFIMSCSLAVYVPAFYFLFRCITHDFGRGALIDERATDLGLAGLIWSLSVLFMALSIKVLVDQMGTRQDDTDEEEI